MTAAPDLERRLTDHYVAEAPQRAPDWLLAVALATIDTTPQRHVLSRLPWRIPSMNTYAKLAIAAVVAVAVGVVGLTFLQPRSGPSVGGPDVSPSPPASPSASPNPSPPPLTGTFSSPINGLSISYPAGWAINPAVVPWTGQEPKFDSLAGDILFDPALTDHLFLSVASRPLAGQAGEAWAAEGMTSPELGCGSTPKAITVDGADGLLCEGLALVWVGDRGYAIWLYASGDDPWLVEVYDEAWFRTVLDTVQLRPEDAAGSSPSAGSSASP